MWYLNTYSYGACLGTEFPVNTYSDESLDRLAKAAVDLLSRTISSGIDEIRISVVPASDQVQPLENSDTIVCSHHDEEFVEGLI